MKLFSDPLKTLRQLYINQLQRRVSAEQQIAKALPEMIEKATDTQLKQAFQSQTQETTAQVERLQGMLNQISGNAEPLKCKELAALIDEADEMVKKVSDDAVRDVALISVAQRIKHYEIAMYGELRRVAQIVGEPTHADLLDQTLHEEWHADHLLTSIADRLIPEAEKAA